MGEFPANGAVEDAVDNGPVEDAIDATGSRNTRNTRGIRRYGSYPAACPSDLRAPDEPGPSSHGTGTSSTVRTAGGPGHR
ncbi:hypothetical protein [Streptomyces sp. VRA16 Mangrove soil]|uniref:hypothetical protein n=1 Tax=Streptomyces sp. VRA16 Mangrove soil TaxID=2817434 RepID=UPI001A9F42C5|nr:hypothetical protein [Streptomyces sp. VRA16 Mangrove soil]MBO1332237.1 hypothetical protein [Streptomyces sp. VRA16 Mangrove soil]